MKRSVMVSLLAGAALLVGVGSASALSVSYVDGYADSAGSPTTTSWNYNASLLKFNPTLGTLNKVTFDFVSNLAGQIRVESLDASPSTINAQLGAVTTATGIPVWGPQSQTLTGPLDVFGATAFDGAIDWAGTSGTTFPPVAIGPVLWSMSTTAPGDLALFTGMGSLNIPLSAVAKSSASGAGNLVALIQTAAGAYVKVTYEYEKTNIPEPSTFLLLGAGLLGVVAIRRRVRK